MCKFIVEPAVIYDSDELRLELFAVKYDDESIDVCIERIQKYEHGESHTWETIKKIDENGRDTVFLPL